MKSKSVSPDTDRIFADDLPTHEPLGRRSQLVILLVAALTPICMILLRADGTQVLFASLAILSAVLARRNGWKRWLAPTRGLIVWMIVFAALFLISLLWTQDPLYAFTRLGNILPIMFAAPLVFALSCRCPESLQRKTVITLAVSSAIGLCIANLIFAADFFFEGIPVEESPFFQSKLVRGLLLGAWKNRFSGTIGWRHLPHFWDLALVFACASMGLVVLWWWRQKQYLRLWAGLAGLLLTALLCETLAVKLALVLAFFAVLAVNTAKKISLYMVAVFLCLGILLTPVFTKLMERKEVLSLSDSLVDSLTSPDEAGTLYSRIWIMLYMSNVIPQAPYFGRGFASWRSYKYVIKDPQYWVWFQSVSMYANKHPQYWFWLQSASADDISLAGYAEEDNIRFWTWGGEASSQNMQKHEKNPVESVKLSEALQNFGKRIERDREYRMNRELLFDGQKNTFQDLMGTTLGESISTHETLEVQKYRFWESREAPEYPHNIVLEVWFAFGAFGAGLFALFLLWILQRIACYNDSKKAASAAGLFLFLFTFCLFSYSFLDSFWTSGCGLLIFFFIILFGRPNSAPSLTDRREKTLQRPARTHGQLQRTRTFSES